MKFSVLLSVYFRENPDYFYKSIESIIHQTLPPDEIIIVKDGPLTKELDAVIQNFLAVAPIVVVPLEKNSGLGFALNRGLQSCTHEIVARMDSDDIAREDRFEKQINFMKDHPEYALVGSNIAEFNKNVDDIVSFRKVPEKTGEINSFARRRCPVNHMSVVFKKESIIEAGGYIPFQGYEDYHLWARMLIKGLKFYNLQDNLIFARVGNNMLSRRQGLMYYKQELKLQRSFYDIGFISRHEYVTNVFLRAIPRLMPVWMLKLVYGLLRR
jgi:glycosyltransferase involved in cell wall biosynthesis